MFRIYRGGGVEKIGLLDYLVYILYFPKLLMGPLVEPVDFITQLNDPAAKRISGNHIAQGLKIFSLGLFKKVVLADTFAVAFAWGCENMNTLTSLDCFLIMISYTFEIYFDFSGYSDMAVGASRMLNITLPMNFDSPYKALSIRDFWKRWHISLTKFFTKYLYIPLGGSRKGKAFTCLNMMIVFIISGIWHGAGWAFILWGMLHGTLCILDRIFERMEDKVIKPIRWFVTFFYVNILWLLFGLNSINNWIAMLKNMFTFRSMCLSTELRDIFFIPEMGVLCDALHYIFHLNLYGISWLWVAVFVMTALGICLLAENNYRRMTKLLTGNMIFAAIALAWGILYLSTNTVFVYSEF